MSYHGVLYRPLAAEKEGRAMPLWMDGWMEWMCGAFIICVHIRMFMRLLRDFSTICLSMNPIASYLLTPDCLFLLRHAQ